MASSFLAAPGDGGFYKGLFRDGKRNGYGVYEYADGSRYEGDWKDDKMVRKCFGGI